MTIFENEYTSEGLIDVFDDIISSINDQDIPQDENGFMEGNFIVTVEWEND